MSFIDIDKIAKDVSDRVVERVVRNLTAVVDEYKNDFQGVSTTLESQLVTAKDQILDGFQQISDQLTVMTILLYVLIAMGVLQSLNDVISGTRAFTAWYYAPVQSD
jgi:hypothetical protein